MVLIGKTKLNLQIVRPPSAKLLPASPDIHCTVHKKYFLI